MNPLYLMAIIFSLKATAAEKRQVEIPDFIGLPISMNSAPHRWGIHLESPAHHHFNIDAPMKATVQSQSLGKEILFEVAQKSKKTILFKVDDPAIGLKDIAHVQAFLCDDAKTYCVKKTLELVMGVNLRSDVKKVEIQNEVNPVVVAKNDSKNASSKKDSHGFWFNAPDEAMAEAIKKNKPLMIDFYGIWCPPCNLYNEVVFPKAEFKKAAAKFILLKLDADQEVSWKLKSKFKIGGYPTLIFAKLDPKGEPQEISRVVGFLSLNNLIDKMTQALANQAETLAERTLKLKGSEQYLPALKELIEWYGEKKEVDLQKAAVADGLLSSPDDVELKLIELSFTEKPSREFIESAKVKKVLIQTQTQKKALSSAALLKALDLTTQYVNAFEGKSSKLKDLALDYLGELYSRINPKTLQIDGMEASVADLDSMKMDLAEASLDDLMLKEAREAGIVSYQKLIKIYNQNDSRGLNLELAYLLRKAGRTEEAKAIYKRFIKKFPKEFTFYFAASKFYLELKELKTARETAEKAVEFAYGDNKIRCIENLAKVMSAQGEPEAAVGRIEQFLSTFRAPDDSLKLRTKRHLDTLNELKVKIGKEKKEEGKLR